jgi:hypothetical protein
MRPMEHSTVGQPSVSEPLDRDAAKTDEAERTRLIGHTTLPSLGSGPIFPFSWIFSRLSKLFKRLTSSH